jgi:hypothetical protein
MGGAYQAQMGIPLTFFHPVRDFSGAFVAGQAAAVTKSLLGPDRLDAPAELPALADDVTGWVRVTFTSTRLGEYTLTLTNPDPPTADALKTDYPIVSTAGIALSQALLTSLDRVRTRLQLKKPGTDLPIQPGDSHPFDALLNLLISEVSDSYQGLLGRTFAETDYIQYLDGTGRSSLVLGAGPLVSFTSLNWVDYQDNGAGGVTEVLTLVPRSTYVLAGLRTQPRFYGLGRIDLVGCGAVFTRGPKRYKAVYRAGFSPLPEGLVGLATEEVVFKLMTAQTGHLLSQTLGDGSITYMRPQQMLEARESILAPYLLEAA